MLGIGAMLRNAREEQGFTLEDMRRKTNIQVDYLRFLEEEKFDQLPSPFYTRGFLRAYAKSLKLDAMYILKLYENSTKHQRPMQTSNRTARNQGFSQISTTQTAQQVTSSIPKVGGSRFPIKRTTNRQLSMSQIETFAPRRKVHRKRKKGLRIQGLLSIVGLLVVFTLVAFVYFSYK